MKSTARSVQAYIAECAPESRKALKELRALIRATAPRLTEKISYGIPAFNLNGRYLVYIAGWKNHISLYPVTGGVAREFKDEITEVDELPGLPSEGAAGGPLKGLYKAEVRVTWNSGAPRQVRLATSVVPASRSRMYARLSAVSTARRPSPLSPTCSTSLSIPSLSSS